MNIDINFNVNVNIAIDEKSIGFLERHFGVKPSPPEGNTLKAPDMRHFITPDGREISREDYPELAEIFDTLRKDGKEKKKVPHGTPGENIIGKGPITVPQHQAFAHGHGMPDEQAIEAARSAKPAKPDDIRIDSLTEVAGEAIADLSSDQVRGRALTLIETKRNNERTKDDALGERLIKEAKPKPKKKKAETKKKTVTKKIGSVSVPPPGDKDDWITMSEFCNRRGYNMAKVKKMYEQGIVKYHKVHARRVLIHKSELFRDHDPVKKG